MLQKYGWYVTRKGYIYTVIDRRTVMIHRMILGITNSKITIDHHDSNKLNNRKNNLILMSHEENSYKSWHEQGTHDCLRKPVQMIDSYTNQVLKTFGSVKEAATFLYENGFSNKINQGAISNACLGRTKTSCGFKWGWIESNLLAQSLA